MLSGHLSKTVEQQLFNPGVPHLDAEIVMTETADIGSIRADNWACLTIHCATGHLLCDVHCSLAVEDMPI